MASPRDVLIDYKDESSCCLRGRRSGHIPRYPAAYSLHWTRGGMLRMSRLGCGSRWLVALDRHKQEVGILKVTQELHGISLLCLDHYLLSEELIELGV